MLSNRVRSKRPSAPALARPRKKTGNNVTNKRERRTGNSRAYTLDRLSREEDFMKARIERIRLALGRRAALDYWYGPRTA